MFKLFKPSGMGVSNERLRAKNELFKELTYFFTLFYFFRMFLAQRKPIPGRYNIYGIR